MKDAVDVKVKESSPGGGFGIRHVMTLILSACLAVNYMLRVNLSVAVVAMTDHSRNDSLIVFDWSPEQKGLLLSSFFTGYLVSNLAASVLVTKYCNKSLLLASVSYSTIVSAFTPLLVTWGGYTAMFLIRVTMGMVQGFMMPVTHGLLSRWIPINERSRCGSIVLGGSHLGTIFSFASSGFLCASSWGWPSVFYFSAVLSGIWCLVWLKYAANGPDVSKHATEEEKDFIKSTMPQENGPNADNKRAIPWKMIFTNVPTYALALVMIGQNWSFWILITQIPSYFSHVLKMDASQNGALSAMPYLTLWLVSFPVSILSDYMISRKITSITTTRKLFNTLGQIGAALGLLFLAYTTSKTMAVTCYTIAVTMISFTFVGYHINPLDIAPNYAGLLMGLTNGIAHITAIVGPAFVGFVVKPLDNVEGWKLVFLVASAMFFIGSTIFVLFGSADVQEFNNYQEPKPESDTEKAEKEPLKS